MKDRKWIYYNPTFESEQYNPMMLVYSPWTGHKRFAYDYVRFMEPEVIVELGSYYGCSAFSFLQAIKDGGLSSGFYAIDTWAGDDYTQNDYKEDIYGQYKSINEKCFSGSKSVMIRKTFDEALCGFLERSIDLLHIDGSHSYEDVKHDYLTWKDKVKDNGVIFFHDVGEDLLYGEKMGSHIFWEELKNEMPYTMEFGFSNGLGILFKNEEQYRLIKEMVSMEVYQSYINLQDTINKDEIRKNYFAIRDLNRYNSDLKGQIDILNGHLADYKDDTVAKQRYIEQLEQNKKSIDNMLKSLSEEKENCVKDLQSQIEKLKSFADEKESYAYELEKQKSDLSTFADEKTAYADSLKKELEKLNNFAEEKNEYAKSLEKQMTELKAYADGKTEYSVELEKQLKELNAFAEGKDRYASELEEKLSVLNKSSDERENDFRILQQYANDVESNLNQEIRKLLSESEQLKAVLDELYEERDMLQTQLETIKEKLKRVPFGSKLLKGIE